MGEALARDPRIVEAEAERRLAAPGDVRHERIVAVCNHPGALRQRPHALAPALGDQLELAVAVQLVAEEVPEQHRLRPDPPRDVGKRSLVHLEEAQLGVRVRQERRRDAGDEVRAGPVVGQPEPFSEDLRDHSGGRRLPVRGRDEGRSEGQPAGEIPQRAGVDRRQDLAGQGRAAAPSRKLRKTPGGARDSDLQPQAHALQSIRHSNE